MTRELASAIVLSVAIFAGYVGFVVLVAEAFGWWTWIFSTLLYCWVVGKPLER